MNVRRTFFVAYVATVISGGAALLVATWLGSGPFVTHFSERFLFWLLLSLVAECFWLDAPGGAGMISMSLAVNVATLFLLPLPHVVMIAAISVAASDLVFHRRDALRAYFNAGQTSLSMAMSLLALRLISGAPPESGSSFILGHPIAALSGLVVFFIVNTGLVAGVISLHRRIPYLRAWRENFGFGYNLLSSAVLALMGLTLVIASDSIGYMSGLLYLLFLFFVRDAYLRFARDRATRMPAGS